jgi:hypothetical protein
MLDGVSSLIRTYWRSLTVAVAPLAVVIHVLDAKCRCGKWLFWLTFIHDVLQFSETNIGINCAALDRDGSFYIISNSFSINRPALQSCT